MCPEGDKNMLLDPTKKPEKKWESVKIESEDYWALRKIAEKDNRPLARVLKMAIKNYLKLKKFRG